MGKKTTEQQELDFAAAEGVFRERLSTLGNLCKVLDFACHTANVLRFLFEEGGCHRPVELDVPRIAGLPWVLSAEKTVRRDLILLEELGIIEIERDRRGANRQAPNAARLLWSSVLRRLYGEGRFAVSSPAFTAGPSESPSDRSGRRFSDGQAVPSDGQAVPSDGQAVHLKPLFARSPIRVHACAHGLLSLSSSISVVDDVREERRAEFAEVWALIEEARRPLYPVHWPSDPEVKKAFSEAGVLAAMLFSRNWLMAATRATKAKGGTATWRYWVGCLRNGLIEIERVDLPPSKEILASYYSQLTNAVAAIAAEVVAECSGDRELVPAEKPPSLDPERERQRARKSWGPGGAKQALLQSLAQQQAEGVPS